MLRCPADVPGTPGGGGIHFYDRGQYLTSYIWNGAVIGYANGATYKSSRFKADAILIWEADERTPYFFNDASSYPDEGISERHGKGATVGLFGGAALRMNLSDFYWLAAHQLTKWTGASGGGFAVVQAAGNAPNQLWCNPRPGSNGGP